MEKFASTDTLMGMLERGEYKRPVMENDENDLDFFDPDKADEAFEAAFENYKEHTSRPENYEYFARRMR
jgi:hypothetical protein